MAEALGTIDEQELDDKELIRHEKSCGVCGTRNVQGTGIFANGFWFCDQHKYLRERVVMAHNGWNER